MTLNKSPRRTLDLFCKVIDNFGDIGICWRLARQLRHEHDIDVTLWVDDLMSFQRICPDVVIGAESQQVAGVTVRHWHDAAEMPTPEEVADIVIEFFGCDIPPNYLAAMAARPRPPVWLNLEGLSAEEWVEGCHTLPSPHGQYSLTKYFFFPGFTPRTGGLLCESSLVAQRSIFQNDAVASRQFLQALGLTPAEIGSFKVSLFCYPHAPVAELFNAWQGGDVPMTCLVPEGVAVDAVNAFFGAPAMAGSMHRRGALTVRVLPFIPQPSYDKLLWACDVNFVRGEDSFVRAQWANRPFVWHIYPQDKNLHHVKLNAFLQNYAVGIDHLAKLSRCWNGIDAAYPSEPINWSVLWRDCVAKLPDIARRNADWQQQVIAHGVLASNLMRFAATLQSVVRE